MQEWQYHVMPLEGKIEEIAGNMNTAGFQGWELVAVTTLAAATGTAGVCIAVFKRPLNLLSEL